MKPLRPIMIVGTASDVGKSLINAGLCRLFLQDGLHPAPFKAQNMSLNSYATPDECEIGRAQAVQAEACGIECSVDMNPILLKPTSDQTSQIVLRGKPIGNKTARDYFDNTDREALFNVAMQAYDNLAKDYNPMVIEGAGSISEMNLWSRDIVNMRVALATNAATYLVADIDRGGVFANVYGTIALLPEKERAAISGIIINKFRGEPALFQEGKALIEQLTGKPVVGILPYLSDLWIEQEDSVVIDSKAHHSHSQENVVNIAVLRLRYMSNFTDFEVLERSRGVHLYYTNEPKELKRADIIIIPGSKNTIADLQWIHQQGLTQLLTEHHRQGKPLYGICGGYQIMGQTICDPEHIEGSTSECTGLGIFPTQTILLPQKKTRQCRFNFLHHNLSGIGYEIHSGTTHSDTPLCTIDDNTPDGYYLSDKAWGSYIHGILDNQSVVYSILSPYGITMKDIPNIQEKKQASYDRLANTLRTHLDMEYIYKTMRQC